MAKSPSEIHLEQEDARALIQRYAVLLVEKRTQRETDAKSTENAMGTLCYRNAIQMPLDQRLSDPEGQVQYPKWPNGPSSYIKHDEAPLDADHYQHTQKLLNQGETDRE